MMEITQIPVDVHLPRPHAKQAAFIDSPAKRKVIRAGRRGGKTVGIGVYAVQRFLAGKRVLYAAPTSEQIQRFWVTVTRALGDGFDKKALYKNESEHIIERKGTEQRIRAKTAWNADSLRGDYADELLLDEWQLMNEDAWGVVGAPMLLDNNGNATFIYTPPSLRSRSASKADDPQHAAKLFKKAQLLAKTDPLRWATFHFSSMDNPYISREALDEITSDMSSLAYRMEILAEDIDQAPGALWTRENIEKNRVIEAPELSKTVVAIDPTTSADGGGDAAGIIVAGSLADQGFVLEDCTLNGSPLAWAQAAVDAYHRHKANLIVAEKNQGGEMVAITIKQVDKNVPIKLVHASRGKIVRAEPVSAKYEKDRVHHVGPFPQLEDELCLWLPGDKSPNRLDALVWAMTDLMGETPFDNSGAKDFPDEN
ncbi:MAG: hypothetical protein M0R00_06885 [Candidatus Omnitrophica bacterium]|jgi:hypothetical protein|nr:hypothetical protein [Candidatus Omnitrophota bacterium]